MTLEEFNIKYDDYLEDGFYGLAIENQKVIDFLDSLFSEVLIHVPEFQYAQIKLKFGMARFYTSLPFPLGSMIEREINRIVKED